MSEVESGSQTATLFHCSCNIDCEIVDGICHRLRSPGGLCAHAVCLRNVRRANSGISRSRSVIPQSQTHHIVIIALYRFDFPSVAVSKGCVVEEPMPTGPSALKDAMSRATSMIDSEDVDNALELLRTEAWAAAKQLSEGTGDFLGSRGKDCQRRY